ncbi:MAG TPA: DUF917 domain-containing protein [Acidimicrobiia bacterium]|jgi:hypothetical protein|nr:DUF917 domain-containing protein [Acidimicrobiia bacterium]
MRTITERDLEPLATGAAVLGSGGGGDPYLGKLLAMDALANDGPVTILDLDEVPDDAVCAMSAVMGAPTVLVEKIPGGGEQLHALGALEKHIGRPITHILCAEVGGLNSTLPIVAAARTGLPLVDCDAMGRAFPEIQMSTPTLYGVAATPMALADDKGNTVVIEAIDNRWTERMARSITIDMGAAAYIALFVQSGAQAKRAMIAGSLSLAQSVGAAMISARNEKTDPVAAALASLGGTRLFEGKVVDVTRRTEAGFARGRLRADGTGSDAGSVLEVEFQNENLIARRDGQPVATVPDVIVVLEAETAQPIPSEHLRYGYRIVVVAAPCDRRWRTPQGLELVGPRYFGYDLDYIPFESMASPGSGDGR